MDGMIRTSCMYRLVMSSYSSARKIYTGLSNYTRNPPVLLTDLRPSVSLRLYFTRCFRWRVNYTCMLIQVWNKPELPSAALPFHAVLVSRRCSSVSDNPGFLNEQRALYQTIHRAPSSFELLHSPWRRALLTSSTNMRIQEMTWFWLDDTRDPLGP